MKFVFACAVGAFFLPVFSFAAANVVINEIAWMGSPPKAGESASVASNNEWIELKNTGTEVADLTGWRLEAVDGQPSIALSGSIGAVGYFLLERTNDETVPGIAADLIYTGALSNSGEKLALKNAAGTIIDSVDATSPPAGGGWPAGDNTTKETMQRVSAGGWITAAATPRAANERGSSTSVLKVEPQTSPPTAPALSAPLYEPRRFFTVDAGEDIKTVAGAEVRFQGAAYGLDGKLLDETSGNVRYLWNFGDGAFFEGKNTNHIYRYPGTYRAALQVSSGQTSGSGVVEVMAGESTIAISEIAGAWIELANEGAATVDVSSWQIYSGSNVYAIPTRTIIGPGALVVFPQETTSLLFGPVNPKAELRYANGTLADALSFAGTLPPGKSVMRDEKGKGAIGDQTPGKENTKHESARLLVGQVVGSMEQGNVSKEKTKNKNLKPKTAIITKTQNIKIQDAGKKALVSETVTPPNLPLYKGRSGGVMDSNYFWLAVSISIGLIAGAVVLALRAMVLF